MKTLNTKPVNKLERTIRLVFAFIMAIVIIDVLAIAAFAMPEPTGAKAFIGFILAMASILLLTLLKALKRN